MKVADSASEVENFLKPYREADASIGFVPTMGALHPGHASLLSRSVKENQVTVCSIFVNPTQFTDAGDLQNYPRTLDSDLLIAKETKADLIFVPPVNEIYPEIPPVLLNIDFGELENTMEGLFRKGHFNGVATVVKRLLEIVKPSRAYFGEKDFQQLAIINNLVSRLKIPVEVIGCQTLREKDGLALSSRNIHLSGDERIEATLLFKALKDARDHAGETSCKEIKRRVSAFFTEAKLAKLEYFEICDEKNLQPANLLENPKGKRAFIAARLGKTRLIDNMAL